MKTESEVVAAFASDANVSEAASIYDTILVCSTYYGIENSVQGWYATFNAFSNQEEHHFFTIRNEANASLPYCNLQSADSMDYAFLAYSVGLRFFGPSPNVCGVQSGQEPDGGEIEQLDPGAVHFWQYDLPSHCSITLKVQQDVRIELMGYGCAPGYGPMGSGAAFQLTQQAQPDTAGLYNQHYQMNMFGTQGVPVLTNRFRLPSPIGIPRYGVVDGVLRLSEYARYVLARLNGPTNYVFAEDDDPSQYPDASTWVFPHRFGIQFSLHGRRMVQQRGQYHV